MVDNSTTAQACLTLASANSTQKQKFSQHSTQNPVDHIDTEKVVVSLTDRVLDLAAVAILSRGLNFAHTTNPRSNLKDVTIGVERAIQHLPTAAAEEIRQETSRILRHSKSQKRNISKAEREALLAVRNNEDSRFFPQTEATRPLCYQARSTTLK
jgi:hypothetical protein